MDLRYFIEYYNGSIEKYDNSIYEKIETRFTHLFNFLNKGSIFSKWFNKRLNYYLNNLTEYDCIVDLGFSIPYPYFSMQKKNIESDKIKFIFVDNQESAGNFLNMLLKLPDFSCREKMDQFLQIDLDSEESIFSLQKAIIKNNPKKMLIVASEIIEHLKSQENFWSSIQAMSSTSEFTSCKIYLTIPIGIKIPSHKTFFLTFNEAKQFIEQYVSVEKYWSLTLPKELGDIPYAKGCVCALGEVKE